METTELKERLKNPKCCLIAFYNDAMAIYSKIDGEQLFFAMPRTLKSGKHKGETVNDAKKIFEMNLPLVLIDRLITSFENEYNALFNKSTGEVEFLGVSKC